MVQRELNFGMSSDQDGCFTREINLGRIDHKTLGCIPKLYVTTQLMALP